MAYEIIGRDYKIDEANNTKLDGAVCDILCDTLDDLPTLEDIKREHILSGSWAWISNVREHRTLNLAKEWV